MMRALVFSILLGLTACSTTTPQKLEATGEGIVGLATQFDLVSRYITDGCVAKRFTVATCDSFRTFSNKFKQAYPAAKSLWNAAAQFEDKGLSLAAADAFAKLTADLAPFLAMMGGK